MFELSLVLFVVFVSYVIYGGIQHGSDSLLWVLSMILSILFGALLFITSAHFIGNRITFPSDVAKIEQLRKDVLVVKGETAQGVYRLAAEKNMEISENQMQNTLWYFDTLIPDGWMAVKMIDIPENK